MFTISQKLGSMFTILNLGLNKIGASIVNILSKVKIFSKLLTTPKVILENISRSIKNIAVWIRRLSRSSSNLSKMFGFILKPLIPVLRITAQIARFIGKWISYWLGNYRNRSFI